MSFAIHEICTGPSKYLYTHTYPASDDQCIVCKELYDDTECRAIRIIECGHVLCLACFRQWVGRRPETCPFWNHKLKQPGPPSYLERIRNSSWFASKEYDVLRVQSDEVLVASLRALHEHRLGFGDVLTILGNYFCATVAMNLLAAVVYTLLFVVIAAILQAIGSLSGLWTILTTGVIPDVEFLDLLERVCLNKIFVKTLATVALLDAIGFICVVCAVLVSHCYRGKVRSI